MKEIAKPSLDSYPTVDNSAEDTEFKEPRSGGTTQHWGEQRVQPLSTDERQAWLDEVERIRNSQNQSGEVS